MNKTIKKGLSAAILSTISLVGISGIAEAVDIRLGSDFFQSPSGGSSLRYNDQDILLKGRPIKFPRIRGGVTVIGNVDTVVQRQQDCTFDAPAPKGKCTIPIEMTRLSLQNVDPVTINGGQYKIFVDLDPRGNPLNPDGTSNPDFDPSKKTPGEMTIRRGDSLIGNDGTFDSFLDVHYRAQFTPLKGAPALPNFFDNFVITQKNAQWTHDTPVAGTEPIVRKADPTTPDQLVNCHTNFGLCDPKDFFPVGEVDHLSNVLKHRTTPAICTLGCEHIVDSNGAFHVPEPTTIISSLFGLGIIGWRKVKSAQK